MRKPCYYNKVVKVLERIHTKHPTYNMGKHLVTALDEYDLWCISDKEMLSALERYEAELDFDIPHQDDISEIIRNGMNLTSMFEEEEDNGENY